MIDKQFETQEKVFCSLLARDLIAYYRQNPAEYEEIKRKENESSAVEKAND